jgi:hypothetical protein
MIELFTTSSDQVVAFKIDGKIQTHDFAQIAEAVEEVLKGHEKVRLLVEIERLDGISLDALMEDLRFAFKHFRDVERKAVVSNRQWHESLAKLSNKLFPGIEIRHFPVEQRDQALEWIDL